MLVLVYPNPVTKLEVGDILRISGDSWPGSGKGMELAYNSNLHQGYIQVYDRDAKQWGALYLGNGNVGIGDLRPASKLTVDGTIHTKSGGIKFPDGSVQTTASDNGVSRSMWNQVPVKASLKSKFSDIASLSITPPGPDGFFVLTFSGTCSNFEKSNKTKIHVYITDAVKAKHAKEGYTSFWQDTNGGHTRQVPLNSTRIIGNSGPEEKTFYLYAGDEFDGGYALHGMFMVQWFPGSQQQ